MATRRRDTRSAVLQAADEIGSESGWRSATMREIAKRAGCSTMAAYRHFPSRDALLDELADQYFARLAERMVKAIGRARPKHATAAAVRAYVRFALEQPAAYALLYDSSAEQSDSAEPRPGGLAIGAATAAAIARDTSRECGPMDDNVLTLWAGVHGLLTLAAGPQLPLPRRELLRLTDQMAGLAT
jgi:AcrR family transcriptional regulator